VIVQEDDGNPSYGTYTKRNASKMQCLEEKNKLKLNAVAKIELSGHYYTFSHFYLPLLDT